MNYLIKTFTGLLLVLTGSVAKTQVPIHTGWEKGDIYQDVFSKGSVCTPYGATISDSFARKGQHSVRFELRSTDTICGFSKRAELTLPTASTQNIVWYAWSEYLPQDYAFDKYPEVHFQLHHVSSGGSPLIALLVASDKWKLAQNFDTADINNKRHSTKQYDLGPVIKGAWTDWVLYVDFKLDSTGKIKLWRNAELMLEIDGANFNREEGKPQRKPYMKFGIYKWLWHDYAGPFDPATRIAYFDEMRTGKEGMAMENFIIRDKKEEEDKKEDKQHE
jgi:hypothetical protein